MRIVLNARDQLAGTSTVLSPRAVPGMRAQIFSVLTLAAALMLFTLVSMSADWCRLRRVTGQTLLRMAAIMPCAVLLVAQNYLARVASWTLPASLPEAVGLTTIPVILIYWAIAALFRHLEFVDKPSVGEQA